MARETGFEPVTSSLGSKTYFESKSLARFCCEFLTLQHLAESAFSGFDRLNEAQTRQVLHAKGPNFHLDDVRLIRPVSRFGPPDHWSPPWTRFDFRVTQTGLRENLRIPCIPNLITWARHYTLGCPRWTHPERSSYPAGIPLDAISKSGRHKRTQGKSNGKRQ
jgi:hypothetical protein